MGYALDNADIRVAHENGYISWYSNDGESIALPKGFQLS